MTKKLCLALFLALAAMLTADAPLQGDMSVYTKNNCVSCHSGLEPLAMSNRYMDWRASVHRKGGVGCEKCHGGDPAARGKEKAHIGVLPT
ncbi:MAG TPA: multiheme c-type cytochrome, partial [Blastocatellia bacterium]